MTFSGRHPLVEDDLWLKDLQWKTTFGGRQHSSQDDHRWILACCLVCFAAFPPNFVHFLGMPLLSLLSKFPHGENMYGVLRLQVMQVDALLGGVAWPGTDKLGDGERKEHCTRSNGEKLLGVHSTEVWWVVVGGGRWWVVGGGCSGWMWVVYDGCPTSDWSLKPQTLP